MKSIVRLKLFCLNVHNDTTRLLKFYLMVAMTGFLCVFIVKVHRNPDLIRSVDLDTLSFDQQLEDDAQIWQMDLEDIMNDMGLQATTPPSDELLDTGDNMITFTFPPQFSTVFQDEGDGPYIMTTQSADNLPIGLENEEFANIQPQVTENLDEFVGGGNLDDFIGGGVAGGGVGGGIGGGIEHRDDTKGDELLSQILGEYAEAVEKEEEEEERVEPERELNQDMLMGGGGQDVKYEGDEGRLVTALEQTEEGIPEWLTGANQEGGEEEGQEGGELGVETVAGTDNMEELLPPWLIGGGIEENKAEPEQTPNNEQTQHLMLPSLLHEEDGMKEGEDGVAGEGGGIIGEGANDLVEGQETDEFGLPNIVAGEDMEQGWMTTPGMEEMYTADEIRLTSAFIPTIAPEEDLVGVPVQQDMVGVNMSLVNVAEGEGVVAVDVDNNTLQNTNLDVSSPLSKVSVALPAIKPEDIILPFQGDEENTGELYPFNIDEGNEDFNIDVSKTDELALQPFGQTDELALQPFGQTDELALQPFGHIPDGPKLPDAPVGVVPPIPQLPLPPPLNLPEAFIMKDGKLLSGDIRPRYLFPMFRLGVGGPNYQFNSLKTVIGYAMKHDRTVVLSPFFPHHMTQISERIPFNETFDIKTLSEIVPVASVAQFKKDCDNNAGVAIHGPPKLKGKSATDYNKVYETIRLRLGVIFGVKFPGMSFVPKSESESLTKMVSADKAKCLGMYWPHNVAALTPPVVEEGKMKEIDNHLKRSANIQTIGKLYVEILFKDCPFLGIHWSLNEDLKKIWCETVYVKERRPLCYSNPLPSRNISSILIKVLEKHQLGCAYAAFAPSTILAHMRDLSFNMKGIKTFANLYELDTPYSAMIRADENLLSLVEQEICSRAELFIGVSNSWWTYHIARERTAAARKTFYIHDFVLPSGNTSGISQPLQPGGPQVLLSKPQTPVKPPQKPPAKPPAKPPVGKPGSKPQGQGKPGGGTQWKPPGAPNQWKPPSGGSQWKPGGAPKQGTQWKPPTGGQWKPGGAPQNQGYQWKPPGGGAPKQGSGWKPPQGQGQWKPPGGGAPQWRPPSGGAPKPGGQWKPPQNQWRPPGAQNQPRQYVNNGGGGGNWPQRW
ncbi:uncharacterized protein LOC144453764 [Glandiceps talaboti]